MRLMLDSTFLIDHLRGERAAIARLGDIFESGDEPFVNEVVVAEVRTGLFPFEEPSFRRLLEPVEFVQPGPDWTLLAGTWRRAAREVAARCRCLTPSSRRRRTRSAPRS
jgi:predicted nucleic acid-binding protein